MVKISKFYKNNDEQNHKDANREQQKNTPEKAEDSHVIPHPVQDQNSDRAAVLPKTDNASHEAVYGYAISVFKNFYENLSIEKDYFDLRIIEVVDQLIVQGIDDNAALFFFTEKTILDNSLISHAVNSAIIAITLGKGVGIPQAELRDIGLSAFLHHVGLFGVLGIVQEEQQLFSLITDAVKKPESLPDNFQSAKRSFIQHLKEFVTALFTKQFMLPNEGRHAVKRSEKQIEQYAQIIALSALYEILTHQLSDEDRLVPHHVCKWFVEHWQQDSNEDSFPLTLIRSFIDTIGLFPLGSYVILSTDELARIVRVEKGSPVRPVIEVLLSPHGERVKESRIISLKNMPLIYIKEAVDETRIKAKDKKFLLSLKVRRWWTQ